MAFGDVAGAQTIAGVTPNQIKALKDLDALSRYNTKAVAASNPHLAQDLAPIDANLPTIGDFSVGPENQKQSLKDLLDSIDQARATAFGASGQAEKTIGTELESKVPESYLAGGRNFLGDVKRLTPDMIAEAKDAITKGAPRAAVVRNLKLKGFLPRPGEI
jgi:hypothetical protein